MMVFGIKKKSVVPVKIACTRSDELDLNLYMIIYLSRRLLDSVRLIDSSSIRDYKTW